ncbi:MAG TPA: hypothetical protein VF062_17695 [Candidatus Limnocylindrales bacterium]
MSVFETWSLVGVFASIVVNIIVFGALALQVRLLANQVDLAKQATDQDHDRRRRQTTLEACTSFLDRQAELRLRMLPSDYDEAGVAALQAKALNGDGEAKQLLSVYLNGYEALANGARFDVLDLAVLNRGLGRRIMLVVDRYRPIIDHMRAASGNPDLFGDLEWLARKVKQRRGSAGEWIDDAPSLKA